MRGYSGGSEYRRTFPIWPMVLMGLVGLVDQIDVGVLRGVLPFVQEEFRLDDFQLGTLGFAFIVVNSVATIPAGWVADHYRRTRVIGWTLMSWSVLILLSASAWNYTSMLLARSVMGIGQSVDDPASTSLLGDFYPAHLRGRVFSWQQVSWFVGGGIGLAFGGWVGAHWSWRMAFVLVGIPSAVVAALCFRLREPRRGQAELPPSMTWEEIDSLRATGSETSLAANLSFGEFLRMAAVQLATEMKSLLGIRTMRYLLVGVSALLFTVAGIGFWLALYHDRFSGMTESEATATVGFLLGTGGLIGTFGGGWLSDRVARHNLGNRIVVVVWTAVFCSIAFMLSFAIASVPIRLALQFLGVIAVAGGAPGLRAAMMDVVPAESRGVGASAFALVSAVLGTAAAPIVVGALSEITGSLVRAFYIVFPPVIIGLMFLLRARKTIVEDAAAIIESMIAEQERLRRAEPTT